MSKKEKTSDIYFQVFYIKMKHPVTGDVIERGFAGRALFTPAQITDIEKQLGKNLDITEFIEEAHFDKPYNPYEDDENEKALRALTDAIRYSTNEED